MAFAAVPMLCRGSTSIRHVEAVKDGLLQLADKLKLRGASQPTLGHGSTLDITLTSSHLNLTITVLGMVKGTDPSASVYLAHMEGLPAAFPIEWSEIDSYRHLIGGATLVDDGRTHQTANSVNPVTLLTAVVSGMMKGDPEMGGGRVLDEIWHASEQHSWSIKGMERILLTGGHTSQDPRDLKADFSYHVGDSEGRQSVLVYMDRRAEICGRFFGPALRKHVKHGAKLLSRYGAAAFIGVAPDVDLGCLAPFWHPCGRGAAQLAPLFHSGLPVLPVSEVQLEPNGPTSLCALTQVEELRRYLQEDESSNGATANLDTSQWINRGLFGRQSGEHVIMELFDGDETPRRHVDVSVLGVRWNGSRNVLEQIGRREDSGSAVRLS